MNFEESKTHGNLMRAFAGESQARNRYTFAAGTAKMKKLYVVEAVFRFTANQEKEHAEIFYNHLQQLNGKNVNIDGAYPVEVYDDVVKLLKCAHHNEYEEHDVVYKNFGEVAEQEGFPAVAQSFKEIAKIEKVHGDRFMKFAELLESGELFVANAEMSWICLNCGYVYKGNEAPKVCPVCRHEQGYFLRLDLSAAPYFGDVI